MQECKEAQHAQGGPDQAKLKRGCAEDLSRVDMTPGRMRADAIENAIQLSTKGFVPCCEAGKTAGAQDDSCCLSGGGESLHTSKGGVTGD